jgi:hypothetical protein
MEKSKSAAKMTRTSTELPRLEPESSASTNSAMAAEWANHKRHFTFRSNLTQSYLILAIKCVFPLPGWLLDWMKFLTHFTIFIH